jgi:hypothetical protein
MMENRLPYLTETVSYGRLESLSSGDAVSPCETGEEPVMADHDHFADRYIAVWNERDPKARREQIASLWAENAVHLSPAHEARGYAALEERVAGAHDKFVAEGGYLFRRAGPVDSHHDVIRFRWEMVPAGGGRVEAAGQQVLLLQADGRLRADYQFSEPTPA